MDEYVVRYGNDGSFTDRSDYMDKDNAKRFYDKIKLDTNITWKELLYEPLDEEEGQYIIESDSVRVVDLGICKIAVPIE